MIIDKIIAKHYPGEEFTFRPLSGGDINEAFLAKSNDQKLVVKVNKSSRFPEMFQREADGLELLHTTQSVAVPVIKAVDEISGYQYLIMDFIETGQRTQKMWENFGAQLATLHQTPAKYYGLNYDNYIGSLKQSNKQNERWEDFLVSERFEPMLKLALDNEIISSNEKDQFEKIFPEIERIWPSEIPVLIHGDLWSGNYITGKDDTPYLIDPAVYNGHREIDIGMMHLFGGFDPILFETYNAIYPLEQGWKDRILFNQLYPLLVHVNLFGRSYWNQIYQLIRKF